MTPTGARETSDPIGHIGQPRDALKGTDSVVEGMAATETTTATTATEETVCLVDCDPTLAVPGTATADCRYLVHETGYELVVERANTWIIEGSALHATVTGVYSEDAPVPKPDTMPQWLRAVCGRFGIDEVSL